MPTSVNPTLSAAEKVFKDVVWDPLIMAGEAALFTAVPVLNAPVLGAIDREAISLASDYLYGKIVLFVDVTYIKFKNSQAQSTYDSDSIKLQVILHTQGVNSDAYQKALSDAIAAQIAFTRVHQ